MTRRPRIARTLPAREGDFMSRFDKPRNEREPRGELWVDRWILPALRELTLLPLVLVVVGHVVAFVAPTLIFAMRDRSIGAQLAAVLGLPYGFASHFAPEALAQAVSLYRANFQPSEQLAQPYCPLSLLTILISLSHQQRLCLRVLQKQRLMKLIINHNKLF